MRRTTIVTIAAVVMVGACLAGRLNAGSLYKDGTYDFFGLSRYPEGGKLVKGVDLYKVDMEGDGNPRTYNRRVTQWWPRQGVDRIEIQDGMILREWNWGPSLLDPDAQGDVIGEATVAEYDSFDEIPRDVDDNYLRRIRGTITPDRDGDYTFSVSADDKGAVFISSDESEANKKLVCYKGFPESWYPRSKRPSRVSAPIALKKGHSYYYEVIHIEHCWGDSIQFFWHAGDDPAGLVGGDQFATLDGRRGKFRVEQWKVTPVSEVRPWGMPRKFKAHIIGLHGVGNDLGDPFSEQDFYVPAAVLRMEDGIKRTFQDVFSRADQEFLIDLYVKEVERVRTYEDKTPMVMWSAAENEYPNTAKPGEPGTMHFNTKHFTFGSGSQAISPTMNWINDKRPEDAAKCRASVLAGAEYWHSYLEYGGHLMNGWVNAPGPMNKFLVRVTGCISDGHRYEGPVNNGGMGSCRIAGPSAVSYGLFHEMGHGMQNAPGLGGGEIFSDFQQDLATGGRASKNTVSVAGPYRMPLYWVYPVCLFYSCLGEDPNWGYCCVDALPMSIEEKSFFQTLARVGQQRGIFKNGIRGLGDTIGEFGARQADFDSQNQEHLRSKWFAVARNYLEAVDSKRGVYRIPWDEAPEPFGSNIIRLDPTPESKEITADFLGYHDPATYSDWRACIVAVDKDGRSRYSPLWNKGLMRLARREGDRRYWLTVSATPTALLGKGKLNEVYQGRWACRYPWQVTLTGAVPGAPQHVRCDQDDVYSAYGKQFRDVRLPVTAATAAGRAFIQNVRSALVQIDDKLSRTESIPQKTALSVLRSRVQDSIAWTDGAPHANGGGWVASTAFVAPTAYVGPKARVLGSAKVLDNASVEEFAVVMDEAQLSGHARVNGQAIIRGKTRLSGYQRAWESLDEDGPDSALPELTPRDQKLGLDPNGLWANYAMDESQATMLENRYRHRNNQTWPQFTDSQVNGYLYGKPSLTIEGDHRGYAFDGKSQYAELSPRATDLGAITVDITLKWQGSAEQTLLDCGSDAENRFVLVLGRGGRPEFMATVAGKKVAALTAAEPVKPDEWTRVRLEIDGARIALWVNDQKAGEETSGFRPADAFPAGGDKRNFVAAARPARRSRGRTGAKAGDGSDRFKGVIDGVVVYHMVHGEAFAKLPPPILDAGRNPTPRQVYEAKVSSLGVDKTGAQQKKQRVDEVMRTYNELVADAALRMYELRHRSPEWVEAMKPGTISEFSKWKTEREAFHKKAMETDKALLDLKKEQEALQKKLQDSYKAIEDELREKQDELRKKIATTVTEIKDPEYLKWKAELAGTDTAWQAARARVDAAIKAMPEIVAIEEETQRLSAERKEIKIDIKKLETEAFAPESEQFEHWAALADEIGEIGKRGLIHYRISGAQRGALAARKKDLEDALREQIGQRNPEYKRAREIDARLADLKGRTQSLQERATVMDRDLYELEYRKEILANRVQDKENEFKRERELAEQPPTAEQAELQKAIAALEAKLGPDYEALKDRITEVGRRYSERSKGYVKAKMMEEGLGEKTKADDEEFTALFERTIAPYYLEHHAVRGFVRGAMASWANCTYGAYLGGEFGYRIPGVDEAGDSAPRDNPANVRSVAETYAPDNWFTSVDQWDWRTKWEADGSLKDRPLVQKWLKRVRGE